MATGSRRSSGARTSRRSSSSTAASTAARRSTTTGPRSRATSPATTGRSASTSPRSSATRSSGSPPSAGTTSRRMPRRSTGCAASCATRWPTARSGCRRASITRPARYATTEELAALTDEAGRARRLLPHPRPLPARRPLPRPVPRGDRDRPAGRRARPHHPLLPSRDAPRPAGADARAGRRRARRRARRHVRHLSVGVGLDAAPDPAAAVDPGRWAGTAQGPPRGQDRARPRPGRVHGARRLVREQGGLGRRPARCLPAPREPALGEPDRGGRDDRDGPRCARRHLRPAPGRGPRHQPGDERAGGGDPAAVRRPSGRDGRHRQHVPRRQARPADLRQLPAHPRPVRARRGAPVASRKRSAR